MILEPHTPQFWDGGSIDLHRKGVCTFSIGIPELVQSRQSLALSVLGGEADCVISAHHRGAAQRFLNC